MSPKVPHHHKTPDTTYTFCSGYKKRLALLLSVENVNIYTERNFGREEMLAWVGTLFHVGCCSVLHLSGRCWVTANCTQRLVIKHRASGSFASGLCLALACPQPACTPFLRCSPFLGFQRPKRSYRKGPFPSHPLLLSKLLLGQRSCPQRGSSSFVLPKAQGNHFLT